MIGNWKGGNGGYIFLALFEKGVLEDTAPRSASACRRVTKHRSLADRSA